MLKDLDIKFANKEITPFWGLSLFYKKLNECDFKKVLLASDIPLQGSNRGYNPADLILGLFRSVWCGASCFTLLDIVRYDGVLPQLTGWNQGTGHRAYRRYFNKFSQATNQRVFEHLYTRFFFQLQFNNFTLDFDSTVMIREDEQEGATKRYNPICPDRNSHHPLLTFALDIRMIANYWLRPGDPADSTNYLSFLEDTLDKLSNKKVGLIRMDNGFFSNEIIAHIEDRKLSYIIACRINNRIKSTLAIKKYGQK